MIRRGLPHSKGWNLGLVKALALPDGAFKLYVWLRLNAHTSTGALETSQADLSRALGKARGTVRTNLKTLERAGVCQMQFRRHPQARGWIRITDDYWPYDRGHAETEDPELLAYLDRIRQMLTERACVRTTLSPSDELLARQWHARGVPVERIGKAILLGCARKYVSWRNGGPRIPVGSLAYFEGLLAEVEDLKPPAEYWDYIRYRTERMEKLWPHENTTDEPAGLDLAEPNAPNRGISGYGSGSDR